MKFSIGIKKISGQAITELLIILLALLPLFLIIPMIAKYQDISHTAQIASRYAAFAGAIKGRTLNTPARRQYLADNIRRRIFSNPDAPVKTNDVAGNFKSHQNLFWRTPADTALIQSFSNDIQISFGMDNKKSHSFSPASDGLPFLLKDSLALPAQGIYTVNVSVKLANIPQGLHFYEPFDKLDLVMFRSTSLLIQPWTAWSPSNLETHFENPSIFPAQTLKNISPLIDAVVRTIDLPGNISSPKLGQLDFWRDTIPEDRLKAQ